MKKAKRIDLIAFLFLAAACISAQSPSPNPPSAATAPRRVQVDADSASALVLQKAPIKYPDTAHNAGIQGPVVLRVVTSDSGDVKEVTVVSGDPALAQAAVDSVKLWKYKPYMSEGSPAEMETLLTINFRIKAPAPPVEPPLGKFEDDAYSNDYFGIYFPLSRDWVRETVLMRSKNASEGTYVLLAAVRIPPDTIKLHADTSFVVQAVDRHGSSSSQDCSQYLLTMADALRAQKAGQQKGDITQFTIAGHDFYRSDFDYSHGIEHHAVVCTSIKEYMVQWHIAGLSKPAVEIAVSTLRSMTAKTPALPQALPPGTNDPHMSQNVKITSGISAGLLIKKVAPDYPPDAERADIQGSVQMQAVINKTGDVADLEVLSGPIELVVSAVNAVRKWKYRPYLLNGQPVSVQTQIIVNYALRH